MIDTDVLEHRRLAQLRVAAPRGPLEGRSSGRSMTKNQEIHVQPFRPRSLKVSSTDCGRISTTVFRLQFCILGPTLLGTFAALGSKYTLHLLKKKNSDCFLEKQRLPPGCIFSPPCSTNPCMLGVFGNFECLFTKKLLTDLLFF